MSSAITGSGGGGLPTTGGTLSGPLLLPAGTVGAPAVAFSDDADGTGTGIYRPAANTIGIALNGTLALSIPAASIVLTTQAASIGTTNILATADAGMYEVTYAQVVTQAATTSSSLLTTIGWNSGAAQTSSLGSIIGATPVTTADSGNAVGRHKAGSIVLYSAAGQAITYATTYASAGATAMQYTLTISIRRIA